MSGPYLRTALLVVLLAAGAALALLWPALAADVDRLGKRWPDTLPSDRRPPAWTRLEAFDPKLRYAVVAAEDGRFFLHDGIDWDATVDALKTNLERGKYARGGSTITQQLAKNLFLTREKSILRKAREAVLAWRLERALPKRRILELYLNVAEWGPSIYGAESASRHYLGHPPSRLTWGEAATLAAILPSPVNKLNPDRAPGRVRRRRAMILSHLYSQGRLTREEMTAARTAPLTAAEARAAAQEEERAATEGAPEAARRGRGTASDALAAPPAAEPPGPPASAEPASAAPALGAPAFDAPGSGPPVSGAPRAVLEPVPSLDTGAVSSSP